MSTYTEVKFDLETGSNSTVRIIKVNDGELVETITGNTTLVYKTHCVPGKPVKFKIELMDGSPVIVRRIYTNIYDGDHDIATLSEKIKDPLTNSVTTIQESPKDVRFFDVAHRPKYKFVEFNLSVGQSGDILFFCPLVTFSDWISKNINNDNRV